MRYDFARPRAIAPINLYQRKPWGKLGEIQITPATVLWKSGKKGAYLRHYVSMDDFIAWMKTKPTR